jgi:hypothetical protein
MALTDILKTPQGRQLFEKTKHAPEFTKVRYAIASILCALPRLPYAEDGGLEVLRCLTQSIWVLGIQVGMRMAKMPTFEVMDE